MAAIRSLASWGLHEFGSISAVLRWWLAGCSRSFWYIHHRRRIHDRHVVPLDLLPGGVPAGIIQWAKLLIWAFLAGFAERLVPDARSIDW